MFLTRDFLSPHQTHSLHRAHPRRHRAVHDLRLRSAEQETMRGTGAKTRSIRECKERYTRLQRLQRDGEAEIRPQLLAAVPEVRLEGPVRPRSAPAKECGTNNWCCKQKEASFRSGAAVAKRVTRNLPPPFLVKPTRSTRRAGRSTRAHGNDSSATASPLRPASRPCRAQRIRSRSPALRAPSRPS